MGQLFTVLFIVGLIFLLVMAVIYEPAWKEVLRSREARRRREDQARDDQ
jgi:hypothetical protein